MTTIYPNQFIDASLNIPDRVVYKYPLTYTDEPQEVAVQGSRPAFLHGQTDPKILIPCLWIEHDKDFENKGEPVYVQIVGTGCTVPKGGKFLCTIEDRGMFWHIYGVRKP